MNNYVSGNMLSEGAVCCLSRIPLARHKHIPGTIIIRTFFYPKKLMGERNVAGSGGKNEEDNPCVYLIFPER